MQGLDQNTPPNPEAKAVVPHALSTHLALEGEKKILWFSYTAIQYTGLISRNILFASTRSIVKEPSEK